MSFVINPNKQKLPRNFTVESDFIIYIIILWKHYGIDQKHCPAENHLGIFQTSLWFHALQISSHFQLCPNQINTPG